MKINSLSPEVGLSYLMQKFVWNDVSQVCAESSGISTFPSMLLYRTSTNVQTWQWVGNRGECKS